MNMSWFQSLIMGFVSGLAELLPISAEAHRAMLRRMFGAGSESPLFAFAVDLGCLLVLAWSVREELYRLRRTNHQMQVRSRRRTPPDQTAVYTVRLLKTAVMLTVTVRLLLLPLGAIAQRLELLALVLAVNGVMLYAPRLLPSGNKDARNMPRMDSMLVGLAVGVSAVPGISPVGAAVSTACARGVERRFALRFAYYVVMASLVTRLVLDAVNMALGTGAWSVSGALGALLGGIAAGFGTKMGIRVMDFLAYKAGFSGFAYYSWGAALVCLCLYLIV